MEVERLLNQRLPHIPEGQRLIVAIDGRSGAGKTTLATIACDYLWQARFSVDIFRLDETYQGWEGLEPALETWQVTSAEIAAGRAGTWWGWDWQENQPTGPHTFATDARVLLVEGVGVMTGTAHITGWVERDDSARREEALERDGESYRPFWQVWASQEDAMLREYASAYNRCDIVLNRA
ncbi:MULTISPECIES: hypothetical protein [unclassified Rothia (in: high G+C Gram-positive bacteria)]|uniref:hypothetical protein n=1 Tax=unclassified Rothia (in: high G+C Gram-positive bacteria) TaxID=2689056 RepID=UPI00195BDD31|nr:MULTISPECIES: hypothetical protein [unclassified Rothia (in: high G+C Gram-positive bacteria)]MBM7051507.1 hypothetical protein [Rothia sp. ZJ1223]QRZ61291.1 hypothetical protein JR346_08610 [Rothia sp. ZJ932]